MDYYYYRFLVSTSLQRSKLANLTLTKPDGLDRPLEALMDPQYDVVVMPHLPETDYLLRLAQKNEALTPIIVLLGQHSPELIATLVESGARDYLVRGHMPDELVHRMLHYNAQLKVAHAQIRRLSRLDPLTGTLNRNGFQSDVENALQRSERYKYRTALLYLNIDQFTLINEQFG